MVCTSSFPDIISHSHRRNKAIVEKSIIFITFLQRKPGKWFPICPEIQLDPVNQQDFAAVTDSCAPRREARYS